MMMRMWRSLRSIVLLALVYFVAAKVGLRLALVNPYATAVWPPTGIAIAALLLGGYRLWPGVALGAFLANLTNGPLTAGGEVASLSIATGNTLEALLAAYLVNRFARGREAFNRPRDIFCFTGLAVVSASVSATFGVASLLFAGFAKGEDTFAIWSTWSIGDAVGALVITPAVVLWAGKDQLHRSSRRTIEGVCLLLMLITLALAAFTNLVPFGLPAHMGLAFLCTPGLLWAAFRFGSRETAAAALLVAGIAIWGWLHGLSAGQLAPAAVLLELQAYLGVTTISMLAVAADVSQRRDHEHALERQAEVLRDQAQILNLAPVLARDLDDHITVWTAGSERLYGYARNEALGEVSHALLRTRFPAPLVKLRERLFAEGTWRGELEHTARDGRPITVATLWVMHRDQNGQPRGILEVNSDITELKRAEEAQRQLAAIVESSDDAIIAASLDGVITSWNAGAERMYGYAAKETVGQSLSILTPLGDPEAAAAIMERISRGDAVDSYETKQARSDGATIDVSIAVSPIKNNNGAITGASVVARNITDQKRWERQLRDAQKMESIGVLAGGVAHDFNNLLVGILGNACLALDELSPTHPAHDRLQDVVRAGEGAAALVRQLLAYAGKAQFAVQAVSLPVIVREIASSCRHPSPRRSMSGWT